MLPEGKRVGGFVLQQDLAPTILSIMGGDKVRRNFGMDGEDAYPVMQGVCSSSRSEFYVTECTWMRKRGWRTPHYKLIQSLEPDIHGKPELELYDLTEDPLEDANLADERPEVVEAMVARMQNWIARRVGETGKRDAMLSSRPSFLISKSAIRALKPRKHRQPSARP
jgi:arylsulfatase A-like enzyme